MSDPSAGRPFEIRISDPLSDVTRKERRALLGLSAAAIVVAKTGLLPTKIANLGVEFGLSDRVLLLKGLAIVVLYFLIVFLVYLWSDLLRWRLSFHGAMRDVLTSTIVSTTPAGEWEVATIAQERERIDERRREALNIVKEQYTASARWLLKMVPAALVVRGVLEFLLPIAVGVCAIVSLIRAWSAS
jgi:hypothetical protein